jgi:hypothetical protein
VAVRSIEYGAFLASKAQLNSGDGLEPVWMPDFLFDFQRHLGDWAIRQALANIELAGRFTEGSQAELFYDEPEAVQACS